MLDAWIDQNIDTWAPASARDQQSRVRSIKQDKIARIPIAQLSIADVERWHTRLRRGGMRDAGIRNQHGALSAALGQAVRWWVGEPERRGARSTQDVEEAAQGSDVARRRASGDRHR